MFSLESLVDGPVKYRMRRSVPSAYEVLPCTYGKGMFAKKQFKKGDVMYEEHWHIIPNEPGKIELVLTGEDGETEVIEMDVYVHSVLNPEKNQRELFALDGHMNHACDPNTTCISHQVRPDGGSYTTVAIKDIEIGDQITCDYDLIEWDCQDKGTISFFLAPHQPLLLTRILLGIDACACGATSCRGKVWGFKYLNADLKNQMIKLAFENVLYESRLAGEITQQQFDEIMTRRDSETPEDFK